MSMQIDAAIVENTVEMPWVVVLPYAPAVLRIYPTEVKLDVSDACAVTFVARVNSKGRKINLGGQQQLIVK